MLVGCSPVFIINNAMDIFVHESSSLFYVISPKWISRSKGMRVGKAVVTVPCYNQRKVAVAVTAEGTQLLWRFLRKTPIWDSCHSRMLPSHPVLAGVGSC